MIYKLIPINYLNVDRNGSSEGENILLAKLDLFDFLIRPYSSNNDDGNGANSNEKTFSNDISRFCETTKVYHRVFQGHTQLFHQF